MGPIDPPTVYMVLLSVIVVQLGLIAWLMDRASRHRFHLLDKDNIIGHLRSREATLQAHIDAMRGLP